MEGKRNRGEVTAELSEKVWARLCRENALVASEVWVDGARRVGLVEAVLLGDAVCDEEYGGLEAVGDIAGFAGGFGRGDRVGHV